MITVYSKPNCPYCTDAKEYLCELGIPFEDIDISKNKEAKQFIKDQGHTTVPQIYKDGSLLVEGGFTGLVTADISVLI